MDFSSIFKDSKKGKKNKKVCNSLGLFLFNLNFNSNSYHISKS